MLTLANALTLRCEDIFFFAAGIITKMNTFPLNVQFIQITLIVRPDQERGLDAECVQ